MAIDIIPGSQNDLPTLLGLIKELAEFERAPNEVTNQISAMERDGFGPNKVFDFYLINYQGKLAGMAVTYYRYSTWKGKTLYLEDIYIKPESRGKGIGMEVMKFLARKALMHNCVRMQWEVLDWNEDAISFYKNLGSEFDHEWVNCILTKEKIESLASDA